MKRFRSSKLASRSNFKRTAMRTKAVNLGMYLPRGGYRF